MELEFKTFYLDSNEKLTKKELNFINEINQILASYEDINKRLYNEQNILFDFNITRQFFDSSPRASIQFEFLNSFNEITCF